MEDKMLPELDPETLQFLYFYVAASSVIGFILLAVEIAFYKGSQLSRRERGQYLLALLLLGLLAFGVTSVLYLYWGGRVDDDFVIRINDLFPEKGDKPMF